MWTKVTRSLFIRMRNVWDRSCRENQNMYSVVSKVFPKIVPFMRYVEKYCRAGQATDGNMAHTHFMMNTAGYKQTHSICNTSCLSTATTVAISLLSITLRTAHCLSCHRYLTILFFLNEIHFLFAAVPISNQFSACHAIRRSVQRCSWVCQQSGCWVS
jgi:hypothetical protein